MPKRKEIKRLTCQTQRSPPSHLFEIFLLPMIQVFLDHREQIDFGVSTVKRSSRVGWLPWLFAYLLRACKELQRLPPRGRKVGAAACIIYDHQVYIHPRQCRTRQPSRVAQATFSKRREGRKERLTSSRLHHIAGACATIDVEWCRGSSLNTSGVHTPEIHDHCYNCYSLQRLSCSIR